MGYDSKLPKSLVSAEPPTRNSVMLLNAIRSWTARSARRVVQREQFQRLVWNNEKNLTCADCASRRDRWATPTPTAPGSLLAPTCAMASSTMAF